MSEGYLSFLRGNASYRRLWGGNVVNFLGDWFNTIALFSAVDLLAEQGAGVFGVSVPAGQAKTLIFVAKLLPGVVAIPIVGPLVDRSEIKRLLVGANLAQAFAVLGILGAYLMGSLSGILVGLFVLLLLGSVFLPGQQAALPVLVDRKNLGLANALGGGTWSTMLALGSALGGAAVHWAGIEAALVIDALSFILSALILWGLPEIYPEQKRGEESASFWEGISYLMRNPHVWLLGTMKPCLGLVGGVMATLPLLAGGVFDVSGPLAEGGLFTARGLGALTGSLVAGWVITERGLRTRVMMILGFALMAAAYGSLYVTPTYPLTALIYYLGAVSAGLVWVASGTALQHEASRRYLGRITSLEVGGLTLLMSAGSVMAGLWSRYGVSPKVIGGRFGLSALIGVAVAILSLLSYLLRHRGSRAGSSPPL